MNLYTFENTGIILQRTNYFDSDAAKAGQFFLSWNAGAARLLIPDNQKHVLSEIRSTKKVIISLLDGGLQILFDDNTDYPFLIQLPEEQMDRIITKKDAGNVFQFSVYILLGEKFAFPGIFK
jgi:hypothetical protein